MLHAYDHKLLSLLTCCGFMTSVIMIKLKHEKNLYIITDVALSILSILVSYHRIQ